MAADHDADLLTGKEPALTRILVALTRLQERQGTSAAAIEAARAESAEQHRELMARVDTFVPRTEIAKDNAALHARIDGLDQRVKAVEEREWRVIRWVFGIVGTGVAGVFGIHLKGG